MQQLGPVLLENQHVRLEPLRLTHADGLLAAGAAPEIWTHNLTQPMTADSVAVYIEQALAAEARGDAFAFAVRLQRDDRIVGSTRLCNVQTRPRSLEIGYTWYAPDVWGTGVNRACKYLLLQHAFEIWGAVRVQLQTDIRNTRSQAAIAGLGAQREGVLRNHRLRKDGSLGDSVIFSLLEREWPAAKAALEARIRAR